MAIGAHGEAAVRYSAHPKRAPTEAQVFAVRGYPLPALVVAGWRSRPPLRRLGDWR
jgi:hypothetical protein